MMQHVILSFLIIATTFFYTYTQDVAMIEYTSLKRKNVFIERIHPDNTPKRFRAREALPIHHLPSEIVENIAQKDIFLLHKLCCINNTIKKKLNQPHILKYKTTIYNQMKYFNENNVWRDRPVGSILHTFKTSPHIVYGYIDSEYFSYLDRYAGARRQAFFIVKFLLEKGLNPHRVNKNGYSSLYWPIQKGFIRCVKLYKNYGVDLDTIVDAKKQLMPLHIAVIYIRKNIVNYLCNQSVTINCTDFKGRTPLHYAVYSYRRYFMSGKLNEATDLINIIEMLIKAGANPYQRSQYSNGEKYNAFTLAKSSDYVIKILKQYNEYYY